MSRSEEETEEFVGDEGGGSKSFLGSNIFFSSLAPLRFASSGSF